jgi:hypothetical protein
MRYERAMSTRWVVGGLVAVSLGCADHPRSGSSSDGKLGRQQLAAVASTVWDKQARLTSADEVSGDFFGNGLAFEGTRAVVGAYGKLRLGVQDLAGAVYTFERSGTTWSERDKLVLDDPQTHGFGWRWR